MSSSSKGSGYEPAFPLDHPVDSGVRALLANFYSVSDVPGSVEEWSAFFADDATVVMANDTARGKDEIRRMRQGMWEKVAARQHTVVKVFAGNFDRLADENTVELMTFGNVNYRLKTGEESVSEWAGHAQLRKDVVNGEWKFQYYRVYIEMMRSAAAA